MRLVGVRSLLSSFVPVLQRSEGKRFHGVSVEDVASIYVRTLLDWPTLNVGHGLISTILRHDAKQTSYKIALLRAINDVALSYPNLGNQVEDVAVPLRLIAQFWLAYYWPLIDEDAPVLQGARAARGGTLRHDLSFRPLLSELRGSWQQLYGRAGAADGFVLIHELKVPRRRQSYLPAFLDQYDRTLAKIVQAVRQPLQYAGEGQWSVFARPRQLASLTHVTPVPGASPSDVCLTISGELWRSFQELSLWIEALCVHEWCGFTERVEQPRPVSRGEVYTLLTERPDNRRPLTWERNQIELLMLEGYTFTCPWSFKPLTHTHYDLDHLVPVSVYPINELWNLVPSDPRTNAHLKRARLPSAARMQAATPHLSHTYRGYTCSQTLGHVLTEDVAQRFSTAAGPNPEGITEAVENFMTLLTRARNLAVF